MFDKSQELSELKDIHVPSGISVFPLAAGWWIALGLLIVILLLPYVMKLFYKIYALSVRKKGLKELHIIEKKYRENQNIQELATAISRLIKRIALLKYDREDIAKMHGNSWSAFLIKTGFKDFEKTAEILGFAPYIDNNKFNLEAHGINTKDFFASTQKWIRQNT